MLFAPEEYHATTAYWTSAATQIVTFAVDPVCGIPPRNVTFSGRVTDLAGNPVIGTPVIYGYIDPSNPNILQGLLSPPGLVTDANGNFSGTMLFNNTAPLCVQARSGQGIWSPVVGICGCTANTPPGAPTSLTAAPGNANVALTWSAPGSNGGSAITGYNVYRGTAPGQEALYQQLGNVLTYTDTAAANSTTYYYQVTAVNALGESVKSNEANATPAVPTQAAAPLAKIATIVLNSPAASNVVAYTGGAMTGAAFGAKPGETVTLAVCIQNNGQGGSATLDVDVVVNGQDLGQQTAVLAPGANCTSLQWTFTMPNGPVKVNVTAGH